MAENGGRHKLQGVPFGMQFGSWMLFLYALEVGLEEGKIASMED